MKPIIVLVLLCSATALANEAKPNRIKTFTPPEITKAVPPEFPMTNLRRNKEGWVTLTYMVDGAGKAYDVAVAESSDDQVFEEEAIRAVKTWKHKPAILDGQPIDAGLTTKLTFQIEDNGVTNRFSRTYSTLSRAIKDNNEAKAKKLLKKLEQRERNLYEEAFYQLALYNYYRNWGSKKQQYAALRRAGFMDEHSIFLPDNTLTAVLLTKLELEVELSLLGQALVTIPQLLKREIEHELEEYLKNLEVKIGDLISTNQNLIISGEVSSTNRFVHRLVKSAFRFDAIEGDLAEIRLHCNRGFVGFAYSPNLAYTIENDLGDCILTLIGDPGTTFQLVEYSPTQSHSLSAAESSR